MQLLTQGPQIQQNWKSAGRNALIMKIFNNWHQTRIFLLVTEVMHEQRQGSALCCRNLACPFQGLIPSTSNWKRLKYKRSWCTDSSNLVLPSWAPSLLHVHTHTLHTQSLQGPWRCLAGIWCIPLPFLIHHFHVWFAQITFAQPWPWWQLNANASLQPSVSILWIANVLLGWKLNLLEALELLWSTKAPQKPNPTITNSTTPLPKSTLTQCWNC